MTNHGVQLDAENLNGLIKILEMAKQQFDIVFLISHIDQLKDITDNQITIEKENGYAKIVV